MKSLKKRYLMATMYWMGMFYPLTSLAMNSVIARRNCSIQYVTRQVDYHMCHHAMPDVGCIKPMKTQDVPVSMMISNLKMDFVIQIARFGDTGCSSYCYLFPSPAAWVSYSSVHTTYNPFSVFTPLVPSAIMRSTSSKLKGFQQAIQLLFIRLFGAIPGTLLIGWLIDSSCLLWTTEDDGSQAACFSYDNGDFVLMLLVPAMVVKGAAILAYALASMFAKRKEIETIEIKRSKSLIPEVIEMKPEVTNL